MPPAFDKRVLRPFRPLYLIGVGAVVGLSASLFDSWHGKITCRPVAFTESLWMRGFPWLLLGLFAFPVASFCARFPLRGSFSVIATRLGMHLVAAVANGVVFEVTINGIAWLIGRVDQFWRSTVESMSVYGNALLTFYFTVLGVTHAVLYYRESRERERAQARLEAGLIEARVRTRSGRSSIPTSSSTRSTPSRCSPCAGKGPRSRRRSDGSRRSSGPRWTRGAALSCRSPRRWSSPAHTRTSR